MPDKERERERENLCVRESITQCTTQVPMAEKEKISWYIRDWGIIKCGSECGFGRKLCVELKGEERVQHHVLCLEIDSLACIYIGDRPRVSL